MAMNDLKKRAQTAGGDTLLVAVKQGRLDAAKAYLCATRGAAESAPAPATAPAATPAPQPHAAPVPSCVTCRSTRT
jgi:hypothetical protein